MADHLRDATKKIDFISREEAIEQTCFNCAEKEMCNGIGDDTDRIRAIPAADVRPVVKAHWIHMPSNGKFRDTCVCSACKKSPPIESLVVQGFNACPYCFADMRETGR